MNQWFNRSSVTLPSSGIQTHERPPPLKAWAPIFALQHHGNTSDQLNNDWPLEMTGTDDFSAVESQVRRQPRQGTTRWKSSLTEPLHNRQILVTQYRNDSHAPVSPYCTTSTTCTPLFLRNSSTSARSMAYICITGARTGYL